MTYYDKQGLAHQVNYKYIVLAGIEGASYDPTTSSGTWFSRGEVLASMMDINDPLRYPIFRPKDYDIQFPTQTIVWNTPGDYYPYLIFVDSNMTHQIVQYTDYKIPVLGSEIVKQERYARVSTLLAVILFVFTLIESVSYLCKLNPKICDWLKDTNDTHSQEQPIPEFKRSLIGRASQRFQRKPKTKSKSVSEMDDLRIGYHNFFIGYLKVWWTTLK